MRHACVKPLLILILTAVLAAGSVDARAQDIRDANKRYKVVGGILQDVSGKAVTPIDSLVVDSMGGVAIDPVAASIDPIIKPADTVKKRRTHLLRDSIPLSRVAWMSAALPGFGQLYNKQPWKIPAIYAVGGASFYFMTQERNKYRDYQRQYNMLLYESAPRDMLDAAQTRMIQHNTKKHLFMVAFIGTYIYSLGDMAMNYRWQSTAVKRATTLSTILPGAGQFYNKSYWKVPIVLGGVATMAFVIDWNSRGYTRFKTAYDMRYSAQENNTVSKDEFMGVLDLSGIREWRNNYRRNRDLCIIIAGGLYLLNVAEAHVDASLRDYDISDVLAMEIEPRVMNYSSLAMSGNAIGFGLNIRF